MLAAPLHCTRAGYVLIMQTGQEQVAAFVGEHQRRLKVRGSASAGVSKLMVLQVHVRKRGALDVSQEAQPAHRACAHDQ